MSAMSRQPIAAVKPSVWDAEPEFFFTALFIYAGMLITPATLRTIRRFSVFDWNLANYQLVQEGHLQSLYFCRMLYVIAGLTFGNGPHSLLMAFFARAISVRSWVLLVCQTKSAQAAAVGNPSNWMTVWKLTVIYFVTFLALAYLGAFFLPRGEIFHQIAVMVAAHTSTVLLFFSACFVIRHAYWCFRQDVEWRFSAWVCLFWANVAVGLAALNIVSMHDPEIFFGNFRYGFSIL